MSTNTSHNPVNPKRSSPTIPNLAAVVVRAGVWEDQHPETEKETSETSRKARILVDLRAVLLICSNVNEANFYLKLALLQATGDLA